MTIFDHAEVRSTQRRRINEFGVGQPCADFEVVRTGRQRDTIDQCTEYILHLRLSQNFWANTAQRDSAQKAALNALAAHLYEDVLREIPHLILAIESGDRDAAIEAALRIKEVTRP
jgi:hypothetical protein